MDDKKPPNPVKYAEEVLDVHGPYKSALERLEQYDAVLDEAATARKEIREAKRAIADRRLEIASDAPNLVPNYMDLNTTQRRDSIKILINGDDKITELESALADHQSSLEESQADIKYHEQGLFVHTARMTELGGLLHFYAASKEAQTAKRNTTNDTSAKGANQA